MLDKPTEVPPFNIDHPLNDEEARGIAAARALIGEDVGTGLAEVRRLRAGTRTAIGLHNRLRDDHYKIHGSSSSEEHIAAYHAWPGMAEAEAAVGAAVEAEYYAARYLWKLPIRSVADAIAKAKFAMENADLEDDDEDFKGDALRQIADFLAPQEMLQAAE